MNLRLRVFPYSTTAVALLALLHGATGTENHEQEVTDGCRDSRHHNCALVVDKDGCDMFTERGAIFGETVCRASCGNCDVDDNSVAPDSSCYPFGQQEISLSFSNMEPRSDDWIGIYEEIEDGEDLGDLIGWYWLSGNKRDHVTVAVGTVTFPWLPPGTYRAVLSRNKRPSKNPQTKHGKDAKFAESSMFEVVRGDSCTSRRMENVGSNNAVVGLDETQNINLRRRKI